MRPTTPRPLTDTPYVPPQRMFWRCRHCHAWVMKTKDGLVTPALGWPHQCTKEVCDDADQAK